MSAPPALIEFFQKEATEYLDRLDQLLGGGPSDVPDVAVFLASARALRGSAMMTRLEGLPEVAATVERVATGLRDQELRWDDRLHLALNGALSELRELVARTPQWTEHDARRARTQSVALAALAAGSLASGSVPHAPAGPVMPIGRFFPDHGAPGIVQRNPQPAITLAQRFRLDLATAADGVAREARGAGPHTEGNGHRPRTDGVRRALLALADIAESYGAASVAALATRMARAPLATAAEHAGVQAFAQLLMDRELTDAQLAQQVKQANLVWSGQTAPEATVVPVESLLYRGKSALARARQVRDQLAQHWQRGTLGEPEAHALFEELSDLLELAGTT